MSTFLVVTGLIQITCALMHINNTILAGLFQVASGLIFFAIERSAKK